MADTLALPKDGKHIVSWEDQNEAWHFVYCGIKAKAEEIKQRMHFQAKAQTKTEIQKATPAVADTDAPKTEKENKRKTTEKKLQNDLNEALSFYEGQPTAWTDRVMYKRKGATHIRAYDDEIDIEQLIRNPYSLLVFDKPLSGFTCLARYLVLEAWKKGRNWLYLDADKIPSARENLKEHVEKECQEKNFSTKSLRCLVMDGWQQNEGGMPKKLRNLSSELKDIPLIIMSSGEDAFSIDPEKAKREFRYAGLKPLTRHGIRKIVEEHNAKKNFNEEDDVVVGKVVRDMEILNIHRTPEHCLTLLKAYEKSFSETPANRAKMLSVLLTVLFDMTKMPGYESDKPSADHCAFLCGFFCEMMLREEKHSFKEDDFVTVSTEFLKNRKLTLKPSVVFDILHKNRIIIETGSHYKFRHAFWTYYFVAHRMHKDKAFYEYIMSGEMYLSFPEVIEFFAGIDDDGGNLIETLVKDLRAQCESMENELGAKDIPITPLDLLKRVDDKESLNKSFQYVKKQIIETNLPYSIKDEHADKRYDISRPDDQSIYKTYKDYKFSSLKHKLHVCCRVLRNSEFADPDKKIMMMAEIMRGLSLFTKVIFMLSPIMLKENRVFWEGVGFVLDNKMEKISSKQKLYFIWACAPHNVIGLFEDDLHSDRLSLLLEETFVGERDRLIRHLLAIFLIRKKPQCWTKLIDGYMRAVKIDSVYYANVHDQLIESYKYDFATNRQLTDMNTLIHLWYARKLDAGEKHGSVGKNLKYKAMKLQGHLTLPQRKVEDEE